MDLMTWLKRIFSVGTISAIIGLFSLILAYMAFVRDSPGELTLCMSGQTLGKSVRCIYLFADIKNNRIDFLNANNHPYLGNLSQKAVEDCSVVFSFDDKYQYESFPEYTVIIDSTSNRSRTVEMLLKEDRLGYMASVNFPLGYLYTDTCEQIVEVFNWYYITRGMKDVVNYKILVVGLDSESMSAEQTEQTFIKAIRPLLLEETDFKKIVIAFRDHIVENPKHTGILRSADISHIKVKDLQ